MHHAVMALAEAGALMSWRFTLAEVFRGSARERYFPKCFARLSGRQVSVIGMIIIALAQSLLAVLTMSPKLEEQFFVLVDLAVVTNLVPFLFALAVINVMLDHANLAVSGRERRTTLILSGIGSLYSLYALYASGPTAMLWGGLVSFAGIWFYGFISREPAALPEPVTVRLDGRFDAKR